MGSVVLSQAQRDRMLALIQDSTSIRCHLEFFVWLQLGVVEFLPHDMLLAAWGDFESGRLNYDISSKLANTHHAEGVKQGELVPFLQTVHAHWLSAQQNPLLIRHSECTSGSPRVPNLAPYNLSQAQSCLVHGLHDRRTGQDCLYLLIAFEDRQEESMKPICSMLIPHVDATLRRIEILPASHDAVKRGGRGSVRGLTGREEEIMHWVGVGKTNQEIGQILGISANTAKNHLRHIYKKLNVANRAQAVARIKSTD